MEEEEPPDDFGKQAAKAQPASLRAKPFLPPPSAALRSISSGQCLSAAAQQSTPCPPSANTHLPQREPAEPRAKQQGSLDNQGATPEGSSNRLTPSMQCPALSMRSNLLFLSACGLLQLPELRVPASCTPLLSLLPSLASAAVCSQAQAAEHQPQQDGASTYSMYPTAAAAIGAVTAAAAMMQQLAPMPSTACVERETVQPQLEPASPEGMHTTDNPHPSQPAGQTSGSAEGASKEAHGGALEPLLCSYCGQPRPCAAPCPLGVALAAIQGLHLRGNYCTGRFRVCCYISQPQRQQPQQQQLQEQEVLLSTSQSSPSLTAGTSAADLLPLHQGPQECTHQASAEDPETGVAAAGLQMPLSPASSLVSSTSPDLAAIVAAAAAATVQPSEDGSAAAEIGRAYFQSEDGSVTAGRDGSHYQMHHYCPSLEQPQQPPPQEHQQQQQQQGMKAQGCIDGAAQSARWKGPCRGRGEGEVEQQESYLARSIPENQDAAAAVAQQGAHSTRGEHSKKNGMHRVVSFAGNKGESRKGDRRRSSKTSQGSSAAERPLARAFRSFGNTSTTAAAAASAAELDTIPRSRSFTAESSPEPPGGGPKKMHMQRKGRFLVVSYEDVVSAAKAAALAALVASADEDHGAAAAAAAAAASLTEADTQQLGTSPLVGPHHQQQQQQQQQCAPHSVQQQQAQECQRVCEPHSHDSQGSTQAAAAFGVFENAPEPLVIELLQQAPPLHHMHAHVHAHATPAITDAPEAASPPDSPAAAAAQGAGLSGVAEDGERSAAAAAAAAAMLEHVANVVAGHVLGECEEVISLAHPGVITPSMKTEDLHAPPPPGSLLVATHLGLTSPPHLSRLRNCAGSPCLTATHDFDGRLAAQLSDRKSSQMLRVFTHVRGAAAAPAVPTLPLLPQSPVLSKAAAFATANGPSHSSSTTIGPCSSRCSTTSNSNMTTTTTSPGAASAFLYHPFSASKSIQHAAPDPAVQAASANPSAAAATTAKSKHSRAGQSSSHEQAANATTSAAAPAAAIAETGYRNAAKPAQSLTQAPPSFNTNNSNTCGPPLPSTPFTTQIHTRSPHPSSRTSPLPSALWVPPSPLPTPPPSPPLPRSTSLSGVPVPHGLPSPPPLPSHSSSPTAPSQSPPAQPSESPLPKEYKRGRFKVIEVKAADAASPSSRCTSPLGHPTPTTPSLSPRASSPGLGAERTSDSAAGTPTRSCSPRPNFPPPPTAFPHPYPLAVAPTALPHQLPPAVALIESLAWDPHAQSVFPPATAMASQRQPLPAWDSLQSVPPPVPPCSEESGGSASTSSTALPILSTVLPLLELDVGGAPDDDNCDSSATIAFPDAHCNAALDAATTTTDDNFSICNSATSRTPPSAAAAAAAAAAGAPLPPPPPPPPSRPQSTHLLHAEPLFAPLATLQGDDAGASLACSTRAPPPPALIAPASSEEDCSPTNAHPQGTSFTFSPPSLPSASRPRAAEQQPPADLLKPHYPHLTSCGNGDVLPNPNHSHPHRLHHSTQHLSNAQHADSLFPSTVPPPDALLPPPISITPCSPQAGAEDGALDSPLSPILLFPSSPSHSVDAAQHSVRGAQQSHAGGQRHRSRQLAQQQQQQQVCANGSAQAPIEQLPRDHKKGLSASSFSTQAPTDACAWCTAQSPPGPCAPGSAQAPLELLPTEHMKGLSTSSFSAWARGDALGRGSMDEDGRGSSEGNALGRGSIDEDGKGSSEEDGMLPEGPEQEELQQQHPQHIEKLQRQQQQYLQPSHQCFSHQQHQHYQEQRHPTQQQQHQHQQHQGQWHPQQELHTHHYQEQQQQHLQYQQQHQQQQHREQWHQCQHPCLHLQQQHHQHQHQHQEKHHQPHHHSPLSVLVDLPKGLPSRSSAPSAQQPLSHSSLPASPAAAAEIAATSRAGGCCSASPLLPHSIDYTAAQGQVMEGQQQQQQQRHSPQVPVAAAAAGAASKLAAVPDGGDTNLAPQQQQQQQQQQRGQDPERTSLSTPPSPPSSPALTPVSKAARKVGRFTIREERA